MSTSVLPAIAFRDLLVAFDFSDASEHALDYARAIARQHNSRLLLVHVMEGRAPVTPGTEWVEEEAVRMAQQVESTGAVLREQGFAVEPLNLYGAIRERVQELVKAHNVDLIVAGTHAGEGLDRAIFGSNAEKLARSVDCPALLIGPKCKSVQRLWELQRVLVATRLYPERANIAIYAAQLAKINHAQLTVLHVAHPGQAYERETWQAYLGEVAKESPETSISERQQKVILSKRHASEEILTTANDWGADLIVMGASHDSLGMTHFRRGALGEVLAEASCPVLAVRH